MYYKRGRMLGVAVYDRVNQPLSGTLNQKLPLYANFYQPMTSIADSCLYQMHGLAVCTYVGKIHVCELEFLRLDGMVSGEIL